MPKSSLPHAAEETWCLSIVAARFLKEPPCDFSGMLCWLTFSEDRPSTVVWMTICPSSPTVRFEIVAGSVLSQGGLIDLMKRPRRMV